MSDPKQSSDDVATTLFMRERRRLVALAYRMLGSVDDAEDVVQEAFLQWHRMPLETIDVPAAWLTTVVTRIALNQLKSARVVREQYIGPWLPEPYLNSGDASPSETAELSDSLSIAFLVVLERLTPRERAVFLLHDVFGHEYAEIAGIVEVSEANCRQLLHRARLRLDERKQRFEAKPEEHRALLESFSHAINTGDLDSVVDLLARDAILWADGGGRVRGAALAPIRGGLAIARFLVGLRRKFGGTKLAIRTVNGRPSLIALVDGVPQRVVSVEAAGGRIVGMYIVANPAKLGALTRALSLDAAHRHPEALNGKPVDRMEQVSDEQ